MPEKRVQDVSGDYDDRATPAGDAEINRIRRQAKPLATGRLERDVDAVLRAKGSTMNEELTDRASMRAPTKRAGLRARKA